MADKKPGATGSIRFTAPAETTDHWRASVRESVAEQTLTELVESLRVTRRARADTSEMVNTRVADFIAANTELAIEMAAYEAIEAELGAIIRERALEEYAATGDKRPVQGVEVKEMSQKPVVEPLKTAVQWMTDHGNICLVPDWGAFTALALTLEGTPHELPCATISHPAPVPTATIATDLKSPLGTLMHISSPDDIIKEWYGIDPGEFINETDA